MGHQALATGVGGGGGGSGNTTDGGVVTLATNDTSKAVTFASTFSAAPSVNGVILIPTSAGPAISAYPDESTRSTSGVTFIFSDAIPSSGFKLSWQAIGS
jgi:hypothetical protein